MHKPARRPAFTSSRQFYTFNMSAHVSWNLFNALGIKIRWEALSSILSISFNEFDKFNTILARMQDSIYHMTLKSHLIRGFRIKTSRFRHEKKRRVYGRQLICYNILKRIEVHVICILNLLVDYRF